MNKADKKKWKWFFTITILLTLAYGLIVGTINHYLDGPTEAAFGMYMDWSYALVFIFFATIAYIIPKRNG